MYCKPKNQNIMAKEKELSNEEKAEKLRKEKKEQSGIPIDNKHVSKDPNRSPAADEHDANIDRSDDHVKPYNKKIYQPDPKKNQ